MLLVRLTTTLTPKECIILKRLDLVIKHMSSTNNNLYCVNKKLFLNNVNKRKCSIKNYAIKQLHTINFRLDSNVQENVSVQNEFESSDCEKNLQNDENLLQKNWNLLSNPEILKNFEIFCQVASKNNIGIDVECKKIIEVIKNRCPEFSDEEFEHLFHCLKLWIVQQKSVQIPTDFSIVLDEECKKRMLNWTEDKILLMNDCFYKLKLTRVTRFPEQSMNFIDLKNLNCDNLLKFVNLLTVTPKFYSLQQKLHFLEKCLNKHSSEMTVNDLGNVAAAYFKYEKRIKRRDFLLIFFDKLLNNIDTVEDDVLASHLKILRYSLDLKALPHCNLLTQCLESQVSRLALKTLTHIAHFTAAFQLQNKNLMAKILERFQNDIKTARLKDLERLMFTLLIFNYDPKTTPFYSVVYDEIKKIDRYTEIQSYLPSYIYIIAYMLQANYYPEGIVERTLHPEFINAYCKGDITNIGREYLSIDCSLEIEHPEYNGPRLKKYILNYLVKNHGSLKVFEDQRNGQVNKMLMDIVHTCKKVVGSSNVHIDALLPHFHKTHVIICHDKKNNEFISPTKILSEYQSGTIKYAPNDGKTWYAIVVGVHNCFVRNTALPIGILATELRHLQRIGYTPILIPYLHWKSKPNIEDKSKYIKNILCI